MLRGHDRWHGRTNGRVFDQSANRLAIVQCKCRDVGQPIYLRVVASSCVHGATVGVPDEAFGQRTSFLKFVKKVNEPVKVNWVCIPNSLSQENHEDFTIVLRDLDEFRGANVWRIWDVHFSTMHSPQLKPFGKNIRHSGSYSFSFKPYAR
jgi:hypothetical protein